jgi:hypothetical protein
VGIDGQTQFLGLQPQNIGNGGVVPQVEPASPTTGATSAGILPASEMPSLDELFSCKLSAIAWDENPDQRLSVIDDRILHEGDGEVFIKKINSEQ